MTILGIDPGSTRIGYGIISSGKVLKFIDCGTIEVGGKKSDQLILEAAQKLSRLINKHKPDAASVEKIYFSKNIKTGIEVAQTRGAILLELAKRGVPVKEYSPSEIKLAVASYGLADKKAVSKMVTLLLGLKKQSLKGYDDATDALAAAIAAANNWRD